MLQDAMQGLMGMFGADTVQPKEKVGKVDWDNMSDEDFEMAQMKQGKVNFADMDDAQYGRTMKYMLAKQNPGDQFAAQGQSQSQPTGGQVAMAPMPTLQGLMSMVGQAQVPRKVSPRMGLMGQRRNR